MSVTTDDRDYVLSAVSALEGPAAALPKGMVEHNARSAIRDLIEVYGPDLADRLVREFVSEETDRNA